MAKFTGEEWDAVFGRLDGNETAYGFPEERGDSVVLASFNIRDFGDKDKRSDNAWKLLVKICKRFDFIAVQEVEDNLESLMFLKKKLGRSYAMTYSDITGALPAQIGPISPHERLAFLYRKKTVKRTGMASDISYDRSFVFKTLYDNKEALWKAFEEYAAKAADFKARRRKSKPYFIALPTFITFIRQPHCASFEIPGQPGAEPYEFTAVNAHLLYGGGRKSERKKEFEALVSWLLDRAKKTDTLPVENLILFGDMNLDFSNPAKQRPKYDKRLKELNAKLKDGDRPADFNFPFLDKHPKYGKHLRSNVRLSETYDQIGIIRHDGRLPGHQQNPTAGTVPGGYDFGVANFVRLFQDALKGGRSVKQMGKHEKVAFIGKFEYDVSDHMPIWIRLPKP